MRFPAFENSRLSLLALLPLAVAILGAVPAAAADVAPVDFARDVLPVLSDNCYHCHGPDEKARKAKLRLDTKEGAFRVEDNVTVIAPGKSGDSELIKRILSDDPDDQMPPPDGVRKLTAQQKQTIKRWVDEGAKWGTHWAFVPPATKPAVPAVKQAGWVRNDVDAFILAKLEKEGLAPQVAADKARLIRRVSLDLTGLPPTPAEVDAFLADNAPSAYEKLIDRLLASPRYGERMASDWLDIARFADTHGYQMDRFRPMHAYRDWVIKAFNQNLPFDQFATWQLAGDLLPNATKDQRLATAFNRLHMQNEEGGIVEEEFRVAYVVDRVNTMGTAFLGMTFECTRCHDHKFDPITQKEFYSLFAFFQNIDESGQTTYFTDAMPVPTMLLSTGEQDAQLAILREKIAGKRKEIETANAAAEGDFKTWLSSKDSGHPAPPGLLAEYSFDMIDNGQAENEVDATKPGKAVEKPEIVAGKYGKAALFGGDNGFTFPGIGHFTRTDSFSLALWIRSSTRTPRHVLVHHSKAPIDAGSRGYELLLEDGRVALGLHHMWPGNSLKVVTKERVPINAWTHITATYDGSSQAAGVGIYIDGVRQELDIIRDGLVKDITYEGGEPDLAIGFRFRDVGFKGGAVDRFQIYGRAITSLEAAHLAGREDLAIAWASSPSQLSEAHRQGLRAFYLATAHAPTKALTADLNSLLAAERKLINAIPEAMVMKELPTPKPAYLLQRGNYDQPGEPVVAGTPAVMPPMAPDAPRNRLGLARWLTDPQHPLTARVTVNRLWQQMFGRGLVETSDNFGSTGAVPTHPELLDYLARTFVDDFAWDQKRFLKFLAMSATYQQSTKPTPAALAKDSQNLLLSYAPPRRLTAEMLRDQALAASGLLIEKIGGPSVKPYQPDGLWDIAMGRPKYNQSQGADLYRRSLYTYIKRTVAPPAMLTFDAADRSYCTIKRQSTSTPLQSLALLNDVQIVEAARKAAERVLKEGGAEDASRLRFAFRLITGREANEREQKVLQAMLQEQRAIFEGDAASARKLLAVGQSKPDATLPPAEVAAYATVAQALFGHDEAMMRR